MSSKGFVNMAKSGKVAATARRRQAAAQARPGKGGPPAPRPPKKKPAGKGKAGVPKTDGG